MSLCINGGQAFFSAALSSGAMLTGFCGTFLAFRIQREAAYYRQPVLDYKTGRARDVYIGLSHGTTSFIMLLVAGLLAMIFGFVLPLIMLGGLFGLHVPVELIVGGLFAALTMIVGYFSAEVKHYRIFARNISEYQAQLRNDLQEEPPLEVAAEMSEDDVAILFYFIAVVAFFFPWCLGN